MLLGCAAKGSGTDDEALRRELDAATGKIAELELRVGELEKLTKPLADGAERRAQLDARRAERDAMRLMGGRPASPDLRDPFAPETVEAEALETQPLPARGEGSSGTETREGEAALNELIEALACAEGECHAPRAKFEAVLASPSSLARQARVVPSMKDGKANGLKLYGIRPRSLFWALGFNNGDLVTSVGGHSVAMPDEALEAYAKLRSADRFDVALVRKGKPFELVIVLD